ncbi:MAG: lamin tail domain-containing protein [Candidatus Neomarinimicrobiota bacterium]
MKKLLILLLSLTFVMAQGTVINDFETNIGGWQDPNYSGSTTAADASTFAVSTDYAKNGLSSGKLLLLDNASTTGGWFVRLSNRTEHYAPDSKIGFWLRAHNPNVEFRFVIYDQGAGGSGYEAGPWMTATAAVDDWEWVEIDLATASVTGWITGDGAITSTDFVTIESIQLQTTSDINDTLYIDDVTEIPMPPTLFFSEYIEGGSYNKALEIYNPTSATVSLADYQLVNCSNGCDATNIWDFTNDIFGTLSIDAGAVIVVADSRANADMLALADVTHDYLSNGDDTYALQIKSTGAIVDIIGDSSIVDVGDGWDVAGVTLATKDHTLIRKYTVTTGNTNWASSAGTDATDSEWIVADKDYYGNLGVHGMATVKFLVDASLDTAFHGGFGLKGSFTPAGVYDSGWYSGAEIAAFTDADNDSIWEATMQMVPDGGANVWKWGIQDENDNWIDGDWAFDVADNAPQTLTYTYPDPYLTVMVTFRVNASTVQDVVDSTSVVDLRGTVTQWGPGTDLTNVGGDYWETTIELSANADWQYKYGARLKAIDGQYSDYWENDLPGADYQGGNRTFSTGSEDMVIGLDYLGRGPDNNNPQYTADPDSIDLFFRVNMSTNTDFDPSIHTLSVAGSFQSWTPGASPMIQEGTSDYWNLHAKIGANGDTVDVYYKNTLGAWDGTEESTDRSILGIKQDTTIQWVYYNNVLPKPFTASDTLATLTFSTSVAKAVANKGFELGDTLLVKYGYEGTQTKLMVDTLWSSIGALYGKTIANVGFDAELGLYYQYYRIKNGVEYRETYFNFAYTGEPGPAAEKRFHLLSGAVNGGAYTILDNVDSKTQERRMPLFRNAEKLAATLTVTYSVDLRPAYYQVLAGDTLFDTQGDIDVAKADSVFAWGVWINGPAAGGWGNTGGSDWGSGLINNVLKKMHDDGVTGGDLVAGDSVFSQQFTYTAGEDDAVIGQEFKFGIGGGDNESGYGLNHIENIDIANPVIASFIGSINPILYSAWDYDTNTPIVVGIDELEVAMPSQFALHNNYPNPFNPTTRIEFAIPIGAEVTINIYNLLGQKLLTVHNNYAKPGTYSMSWNGRDMNGQLVPSGIYLYELDAGAYFHSVKKMTLLK